MQVTLTPIQSGKGASADVCSYFGNTTIETRYLITGKKKWNWFCQ